MLDAKLDEELAEYHKDQNIEELADLLEVIRAVTIARGHSLEELERVRAEKAAKHGGFEKRILLKTVVDSSEPDSLIERICMNKAAILEKISVSMLEKYCWLEENLYKCDLSTDTEYQRRFVHYYRMRFVSKEYRRAFFNLFEQIKNDLATLRKQSGEKDTTIAQLQKDLQSTKTDLAKTRIALEKGLPQELASRLTGETEDDLRKDADTLAQLFSDKKSGAEPSRSHEPAKKTGGAQSGEEAFPAEAFASVLADLNLGGK